MSQRSVERVIGRLATDEGYRVRFAADPAAAIREMAECGLELSSVERRALEALDPGVVARFADAIDPRIQKVCCCDATVSPPGHGGGGSRSW